MTYDPRHAFGERLRELRKTANKTLGELAAILGVSIVYVSDVERGNRPPFRAELIEKIAASLGIDGTELHKLAAEGRGAFELRTDRIPERAHEFMAGLARGDQYPDEFWETVTQLAEKQRQAK
ncbi:MAG: helix-turn-helix transcriptional regulator [Myxococcales bacterium]|jgi:transcriptional regulator with XRE-family HTH domain